MRKSYNIKIVVAAHKPYWMPDDSMYVPVQVGAVGKSPILGFQRDDEGEGISEKNPRYCELTALYWAWKNLDADYVGIVHYRRYFAGSGERGVLTSDEAENLAVEVPVILPKKRHYVIETVGNHYAQTFDGAHLDVVRDSLRRLSPEVLPVFENHLNRRSSHIWNMFIMRRDVFDAWCSWLFPVLEDIESSIDFSSMTPFEARVIGRLSERLLDPWLGVKGADFAELSVKSIEGENWLKKGSAFAGAKFFGKKYRESF